MVRRKVKRKYEVPSGTYRIEWANANPSGASHVEFEYEGGTWYNFDDKWMDVFVEHAVPKVTKDGDKLGEMHSFDADTIEIRKMTEAPPLPPEVEKKLDKLAQRIHVLLEQRKFEEAEKVQDELYELAEKAYEDAGGAPELIMEETLDVDFGAEGPSIPTGPPKQPPILLKDSCCCGATKENPCDCMIMGIMECSATCPCSQNPRHQGKWAIYGAEGTEDTIRERLIELAREQYEWDRYTEDFAEDYPECVQPDGTVTFEDWMTTWQPWMQTFLIAKETGTTPNQVRDIADEMGFGSNISEEADVMWNRNQPYADRFLAEDAEDYGVQPTWMAETEGPSASQSSLDSTNLTDWANANDSDDIKYLVGGFIGGILATAVGAIAGEWAVQRMKKHGKLL